MRSAVTIIAGVLVGILIAASPGHRASFASPESQSVVRKVDDGQAIAKAGMDYLLRLRGEGHLPGITTNEHGNAFISGQWSDYPLAFTMQFSPTGAGSTENYRIVQPGKDSPWRLSRAWQTDTNGQIVQERPIQ
jgi:hypothetical protein